MTALLQSRRYTIECRIKKVAERTIRFVISTETKALDGGVLKADGLDAIQFARRPVVLWSHMDHEPAIGRGRNLQLTEDGWELDIEFTPEDVNPFGYRIFKILEWQEFGSCSVGFIPERRAPTPEEREQYQLTEPWSWIADRWTLLETSIVNIPADGLAEAKSASGSKVAREATVWARTAACRINTVAAPKPKNAGAREEGSAPVAPNESGEGAAAESTDVVEALKALMTAVQTLQADVAAMKEMMLAETEGEPKEAPKDPEQTKAADGEPDPNAPPKEGDDEEEDDTGITAKFYEGMEKLNFALGGK